MIHDELFSDGIGEITVSGSVVRVDLVSLSPTERDANNSPKSIFRQRLIFSVEGFANSVEVMQKALHGLVDAGVIQRSQPRLVANAPTKNLATERVPPSVAEQPRLANASPNFRQGE